MKLARRIAWLIVIPGLMFGLAGCGNDDNGGGHHSSGTSLSGDLTSNLTIAGSPYDVNGDVTVPAGSNISIDPGVEVRVQGNYSFTVKGKLSAEGTETSMIHFTSGRANPNRGDWKGIWLWDADDASVMRYVRVSYAGRYNLIQDTSRVFDPDLGIGIIDTVLHRGAVTIRDCSPTIERCIIELGGYDGIHVVGTSEPDIEYNTIAQNAFNGIRIEPDWPSFWNTGDGLGHATIRNNIIVENDDAGIRLPENQALYNNGLIPTTEYNDIWNNVSPDYVPPSYRLHPNTDVSRDIHVNPIFVDMEGGDYDLHPCSKAVDKGAPEDPNDPDGTRADVGALPLYQGEYDLSKTLSGDKLNLGNHTYHVTCDVVVPAGETMTIQPGARLLFDGPYSLTVRGTINAVGTAQNRIVFTSGQEAPKRGDWSQIVLDNASNDSRLEQVLIEYASMERLSKPDPDTLGALSLIGCSASLRNVTIREAYYTGLFLFNGSNPVVRNVEIDGAGVDGIMVSLNSNPTLSRIKVHRAQAYGIHVSQNSSPDISNALIYDTDVVGVVVEDNSSPTFDHITVYGKVLESGVSGGYASQGVRVSRFCAPAFSNSIIAEYVNLGVGSEVSSNITLQRVNIFTNYEGADQIPQTSGTIQNSEPVDGVTVFVDPSGGNFRVQSGAAQGAADDDTDLGAYGGSNPL